VRAIEQPPASRHDFLGEAQHAIDGPPPPVVVSPEAQEALERLGWPECEPGRLAHLQAAMDTAALAGFPVTVDRLVAYGQALEQVAVFDLEALGADPRSTTPEGALTHVAVGTVVTDAVLLALRRLAQEHESEAGTRRSRPLLRLPRRLSPGDAAARPAVASLRAWRGGHEDVPRDDELTPVRLDEPGLARTRPRDGGADPRRGHAGPPGHRRGGR
jgi:hypothetical protein